MYNFVGRFSAFTTVLFMQFAAKECCPQTWCCISTTLRNTENQNNSKILTYISEQHWFNVHKVSIKKLAYLLLEVKLNA